MLVVHAVQRLGVQESRYSADVDGIYRELDRAVSCNFRWYALDAQEWPQRLPRINCAVRL